MDTTKGKAPTKLQAQIAELTKKLDAKQAPPPVTLKVSPKKAISIYGLGRFPFTVYRSQAEKIVELVKSGKLEAFIAANDKDLAVKGA